MSKRAYRATRVNDVNWDQLAQGKDGLDITLGVDVGKYSLWAVCRWADGRFERPWRVQNPVEIPTLLALLKRVSAGRKLVVAMESSGTYGDALRQALADNQIELQRVGGKAAHDYAEVFDGVPSQHDGTKTQRWWPSWRPWARPCHGSTSQPIPGSRNWRIGWSGWWPTGRC